MANPRNLDIESADMKYMEYVTKEELRALFAMRDCQRRAYGEVTIGWRAGRLCKLETRLPSDLTAPLPAGDEKPDVK